ncbi:MAG TPA: DUF1553 domain-containing protein, partial [Planctomycetia bacterium]|nr:DUF1553 domain-containing protein [Planctomycetia bacterium]
LWIHHFGKGLVRSPNNFGFKGDLPTNPALLDWMASELRRNGGKTKPLQRLIVLSEAYRLASIHPRQAEFANKDPENKLWWRAERRRVDAESLRDAALVVTGELDRKLGGPSFKGDVDPDALEGLSTKTAAWKASPPAAQLRRSVYSYVQRSLAPPLLATFDLCDSSEPCGQRETTMVAPQALALLNNRFFHERSEKLAAKIALQGSAREEQIRQAWRAVLGRPPSATETRIALEHLDAQAARFAERSAPAGKNAAGMALASLCHSLINANEFLYID